MSPLKMEVGANAPEIVNAMVDADLAIAADAA